MGALQSIPTELTEAARVDGGGPLADLPEGDAAAAARRGRAADDRVVRLQLQQLQQHLPAHRRRAAQPTSPIAGATDILISYTYKLAFAAGKGNDYGLASAIAIVIFFIVATISTIGFLRTRSWRRSTMSDARRAATSPLAEPRAARRRRQRAPKPRATRWWRHLVGIVAIVFALFPVVYVVSAAFNADASLTGASVIPRNVTLAQLQDLFQTHVSADARARTSSAHYVRWFAQLDDRRRRHGDPDRPAERARRVRLQPLPLQGPPPRDARRCC